MFILKNLVSSAITRGEPWLFKAGKIDQKIRDDKVERDKWMTNDTTDWNVYSLVEGHNENRRISLVNSVDKEGNAPRKLHGFAGDYDARIPDEDVMQAIEKFPFKPRWIERTLSGNVRLIWFFEKPLLLPSAKFCEEFLTNVLEFFPADKMLPALDIPAWVNCTRYFTNSGDWTEIKDAAPIPNERVQGWMVKIGAKFQWTKDAGAVEIPLDDLRPALLKRYPRFALWTGEFAVGEMGPSFWIEDSLSPKSATIRETGIQTFSGHASQSFYSWGDLLGTQFVKGYQADNLGRAVEGIYSDPLGFYRQTPDQKWRKMQVDELTRHLKHQRHVSHKVDKQGTSDVDRAIAHIIDYQNVDAVAPCVFHPTGIIEVAGKKVLNTSTRRVLAPCAYKVVWGKNFKWVSNFFDNFFSSKEQLAYFLAWLSRLYKGCYYLNPSSGQAIFLAGPVGVGKTFMSRKIVGGLCGGAVDCSDMVLGKDNFGSQLFESVVWTVDDGVFASSTTSKRVFTEIIKRTVANVDHTFKEKYKVASQVSCTPRPFVTLNMNALSLQALPDLDNDTLDKMMLFCAALTEAAGFLPNSEMDALLAKELPEFAQFLLEYEPEPQCVKGALPRFGVVSYHEPSLLISAGQSSSASGFMQIVDDWSEQYFYEKTSPGKDLPYWEGTAFQFWKDASATHEQRAAALCKYDVDRINRSLATLEGKGTVKIEHDDAKGPMRIWRIYSPDKKAKK